MWKGVSVVCKVTAYLGSSCCTDASCTLMNNNTVGRHRLFGAFRPAQSTTLHRSADHDHEVSAEEPAAPVTASMEAPLETDKRRFSQTARCLPPSRCSPTSTRCCTSPYWWTARICVAD
ncbi:hypothetical protein BV20DRAFT_534098 [Pilatotrama ljubarskyi]|nr:hypothetical protein BV20DRAFT_534098 [Pilatotrama ljubarskyi]